MDICYIVDGEDVTYYFLKYTLAFKKMFKKNVKADADIEHIPMTNRNLKM